MHKRNIDYKLLILTLIISSFGVLMIYSASNVIGLKEYNDSLYYFKRQFIFFIIGIILMILMTKIDLKYLYKYSIHIFLFCFLLLILVLIPGIGKESGGARSWISIGTYQFQPSEFMKLGIILVISKILSSKVQIKFEAKTFLLCLGITVITFGLIMMQPDFGTGLVLMISVLVLLYLSGIHIKYFVCLGVLGVLAFAFLIISAPYRLERIMAYLNPWEDPLGSGFQAIQSLFATIPGGLFGHGFNNSIQKHFFLPEPQNDFIFAIVIEEFGLLGGALLIFIYFCIINRSFNIAININDYYLEEKRDVMFYKYLCFGIIASLSFQVIINMMVVVGLLPVTGITLPFLSYGGSSLITSFVGIGIILNISKYRNYEKS